ncbi:MAG TPA: hypothetical protein VEA80_09905 [Vitreimonas sp.]|uniref:hypothetical protein n=1 Tax=Vitreimonas sp. TaxID=3069702 RepID=UPI002D3360E5|nr:hypothetical protein [Vitreimonas sp.]HYD87779.1 hypothetical protein [Vitreimonas sp.]
MRWVDVRSYVGLDRRQRRNLRLLDRRSESAGGAPPSLATALRQLRLHELNRETPDGLARFCARAVATAELAEAYGEKGVTRLLRLLVEQLEAMPPQDLDAIANTIEQTMPTIEMATRGER